MRALSGSSNLGFAPTLAGTIGTSNQSTFLISPITSLHHELTPPTKYGYVPSVVITTV